MGKADLLSELVAEVIAAQTRPPEEEGPLGLPRQHNIGNGQAYLASALSMKICENYAEEMVKNNQNLTKISSLVQLANFCSDAIAQILFESDGKDISVEHMDSRIYSLFAKKAVNREYYFGCSVIHGDQVSDVVVGSVSFQERAIWLDHMTAQGLLDKVAARRIAAYWDGRKQRPRKHSTSSWKEGRIVDAIGSFPWVCTVKTGNQLDETVRPKAALAMRLVMTSIALLWKRPSKALELMCNSYDGGVLERNVAARIGKYGFGSLSTRVGHMGGQYVAPEWVDEWNGFKKLLQPISDALEAYLDPETPLDRPKIANSVLMSLWWFHEACREESDLFAIAKFASSMDALASGKGAAGIRKLIKNLLGHKGDDALFTDGYTADKFVKEVYERTRNGTYHGNVEKYDDSRSVLRDRAELIARNCLVWTLEWISKNPTATDLKSISR